jgi:hypothetical protein
MPYCRLFYHFVWGTKQRLPLITTANRGVIYRVIREKVEEQSGGVHALISVGEEYMVYGRCN